MHIIDKNYRCLPQSSDAAIYIYMLYIVIYEYVIALQPWNMLHGDNINSSLHNNYIWKRERWGRGSVQYSQGQGPDLLITLRVLGTTDVFAWTRGGQ